MWDEPKAELRESVRGALAIVASFEPHCKTSRLEKRVRDLVQKVAGDIRFSGKAWKVAVVDYVEQVFEGLFMCYSDRLWLRHVDLASALVTAIREFFPPEVVEGVPGAALERAVAEAHDMAVRKQLYLAAIQAVVSEEVHGPKLRKKVYRAVIAGMAQIPDMGLESAGDHAGHWVTATLRCLCEEASYGGELSFILPENAALKLFTRMLEEQAKVAGGPWPGSNSMFLRNFLHQAYASYDAMASQSQREPGHGRRVSDLKDMPRNKPASVRTRDAAGLAQSLLLQPIGEGEGARAQGGQRTPSGRTFDRVCVMGAHHCCTNALGRELLRYFNIRLLNGELADQRCHPDVPIWKHRAFTSPPPLAEDVFCICLVKDPAFWIQSLMRHAPRSFYSLHPVEIHPDVGRIYRYCPSGSGNWDRAVVEDLFGLVEFDGMLFGDALELWEATVASYFDSDLYDPSRSVVLRSEDFLYRFDDAMAALAARGLPLKPERPAAPATGPAKEHRDLRSRSRLEALNFYANKAMRLKGLTPPVLSRLEELEAGSLCRALGYNSEVAVSWLPSRPGGPARRQMGDRPVVQDKEEPSEEPAAKRPRGGPAAARPEAA